MSSASSPCRTVSKAGQAAEARREADLRALLNKPTTGTAQSALTGSQPIYGSGVSDVNRPCLSLDGSTDKHREPMDPVTPEVAIAIAVKRNQQDDIGIWLQNGEVNEDSQFVVVRLRSAIVKTEPTDDSDHLLSLSQNSQQACRTKRLTDEERDEAQYRLDMNLAHDASYSDHKRHRADQETTEMQAVENGDFLAIYAAYDDVLVNLIFETLPVVADALLQDVSCRILLYKLLQLKQRSIKWFGAAAREYCRERWAKFSSLQEGEVKVFLSREHETLSTTLYSMPSAGHWLPRLFRPYLATKDDDMGSDCEEL